MSSDTIVALSSTPGPAPRGVVRLSGPDAFAIASGACVLELPGTFGRGFRSGAVVLDRMGTAAPAGFWCFRAPSSYTGEDVVECHAPGAPKLLDMILRRFVACGARVASPGEFTRRALLNGKMDLTRAEAVSALIRARDQDEHDKARALLEGGLARAVAVFTDRLVALLVPVELALDFSDQDVAIAPDPDHPARILALAEDIGATGATGAQERRLWPRVVIRGPANAGKSSLFNALLERDVAIATPVRGTTRDTLSAEWRHGEARAFLVDTAGDDVDASLLDGLARAARDRAMLEADLVLEVRDIRRGGWPPPNPGALRVASMQDLAPGTRCPDGVLATSSVTGEGIDCLAVGIAAALVSGSSRRSPAFLVTARHAAHLERARAALERAAASAGSEPPEIVASDLRDALRELRAVVGADEGDPVLDRIFREFCIGK